MGFSLLEQKNYYEHIIDQVKAMIIDGTLSIGDRLPSEHELSQTFGVSRSSVREALKSLQMIGVIESKQGGGNFVVDNVQLSTTNNLSLLFKLNKGNPNDIIQLRCCIETESVRMIIKSGTPEIIDSLSDIINQYKSAESEEKMIHYDKIFHSKLVEYSGNFLFSYLNNALSFLYSQQIETSSKNYHPEALRNDHTALMNAIIARDIEEANRQISHHFELSEADMDRFASIINN